MASYNMDQFAGFLSDPFQSSFKPEPELLEQLKNDKVAVLDFDACFLKQVLFGEQTVETQENARQAHLKKRAEETCELAHLEAEAAAANAAAEHNK